jgi:hypothetical protein
VSLKLVCLTHLFATFCKFLSMKTATITSTLPERDRKSKLSNIKHDCHAMFLLFEASEMGV